MEPRDKILKGASELFSKYGIRSVTMDDIARHLAISKKTIYQFFVDKNELVETLMTSSLKQDECILKDIQKEAENVIVEVFNIIKHINHMFSKVIPNIFYDLQKYHSSAWQQFTTFKYNFMAKMVEETIERGIREGLVRSDLNARLLSRLRIEVVELGMNPQVFPPDMFSMADVQTATLDHFIHGICTLKGHRLINKYKQLNEEE